MFVVYLPSSRYCAGHALSSLSGDYSVLGRGHPQYFRERCWGSVHSVSPTTMGLICPKLQCVSSRSWVQMSLGVDRSWSSGQKDGGADFCRM